MLTSSRPDPSGAGLSAADVLRLLHDHQRRSERQLVDAFLHPTEPAGSADPNADTEGIPCVV